MADIDHFAIACDTLEEGRDWVETRLGVPLQRGGQHDHYGTHNMLLGLEDGLYLEVIAIDPNAAPRSYPRWFNLDAFSGAPRPTTWIARTTDLESALKTAPKDAGTPVALSRGDLRWHMAVPDTGLLPYDGLFPALIEWDGPNHPAPRLTQQGVRFVSMEITHPNAKAFDKELSKLITDPRVKITSGTPEMRLTFETPKGKVTL